MKYNVELRNSKGELIRGLDGYYISPNHISFLDDAEGDDRIESKCYKLANIFKAITKDGTKITIEVCQYSTISDTWMKLYSLYYDEKRFIKH